MQIGEREIWIRWNQWETSKALHQRRGLKGFRFKKLRPQTEVCRIHSK